MRSAASNERTGIIYIARNEVNLKSYIGQTLHPLNRRRSHHLHLSEQESPTHFHNAIRYHGSDAFTWDILESDIPEYRLSNREELWIDFYDTFNNGYNMTTGGEGGTPSDEVRAEMSRTRKGRQHSDETKQKIGAFFKGKQLTEEHKRKIGEGRRGKKHSAEARAKLSAANQRQLVAGTHYTQTEEHRERVRKQTNAPGWGEQHSAKVRATWSSKRRKIQTEAGQQFLFDSEEE